MLSDMKPLKFIPILKPTLWGGSKIAQFKRIANCDMPAEPIGESWELSALEGSESVVAEGEHAGKTITQLLSEEKEQLVGHDNYRRYGNRFPLLIKFIDAAKDLSVQVHPTDEQALAMGLPNGKTEMWYMLPSDSEAKLMCGLNRRLTTEEYKQMVADGTICEAINTFSVKEDDCLFIPAGRIHSTGKGCFIAEIQQTSDVTFRIYDFKRKDKNGKERELHTEQAARCIDFTPTNGGKVALKPKKNEEMEVVACNYFRTSVYDLDAPMTLDYGALDSFVILIGLRGTAVITDNEGNTTSLQAGETLLIPATTAKLNVCGTIKFLAVQ